MSDSNSISEQAYAEIEALFGIIRPGAFLDKQNARIPQERPVGNGNIEPTGFIADGAISDLSLFADDIRPPIVLSSLPTIPDAAYPIGSFVFLTTDQKLYRNPDDATWIATIDGADIIADSITAGQIAAGAIGADQLAANIVLATLFKTAVSGSRIEIDSAGIRCYDADEMLCFNMPSDGNPIYMKAELQATSLVSLAASLQGATEIAASGIATVASSQANPASAPVVLESGWVQESMPANGSYDLTSSSYLRVGLEFDPNAGAGGTTDVFWTLTLGSSGSTWNLLELLASDCTVNRAVALTSGYTPLGVARLGSYVYVLYTYDVDPGPGTTLGSAVNRYLVSDLTLNATYTSVNMPVAFNSPRIASDGTNLFIIDRTSGNLKWNKYDGVLAKQGSTIDTGYNPGEDANDAAAGNFDFGAWRLLVAMAWDNDFETLYDVISFDSTGAIVNNDQFPTSPSSGDRGAGGFTYGNANAIGARMYSYPNRTADQSVYAMQRHALTNWTTASSIFWAAYTWYDSTGTTHETQVGPRGSATIRRRTYISVTAAAIPGGGGADEPNQHRYYVKQNATDPGATGLKLEQTTASNAILIDEYDPSGAADPSSNGFSALGAVAEIRSQVAVGSGGWSLKGDGRISMGGTAFPGSPVSEDIFYKTDRRALYQNDTARWNQLPPRSDVVGNEFAVVQPSAATFNLGYWTPPHESLRSDINLGFFRISFHVSGGTALSASHKWVVALMRGVSGGGALATITIDSGAKDSWRVASATIAALLGSTDTNCYVTATKTGTPGSLYLIARVEYHVVDV